VAFKVWNLMDDDGDAAGDERGIALTPCQSFRDRVLTLNWDSLSFYADEIKRELQYYSCYILL